MNRWIDEVPFRIGTSSYIIPDDILPNMIEAFKHMGFSITAEGIESEAMEMIMKKIGCDYLQGYHYSKPISIDQFIVKYGK